MEKYRVQRRFIGPIYSAASMKDHEGALDEIIKHNMSIMKDRAGMPFSVDIWMNMLALGKARDPTSGCGFVLLSRLSLKRNLLQALRHC